MPKWKNVLGMPLSPRQEQAIALRNLYPDATWRELAKKMTKTDGEAITVVQARNYYSSGLKRIGNKKQDAEEEIRVSVRQGKSSLREIDRKALAQKLMNVANITIDQFLTLDEEQILEMIQKNPSKMMVTSAIAIDKANVLEDRPTEVIEFRDSRKLDEVANLLLDELKRRENTIDVTPQMQEIQDVLNDD
jgi:hypothetical protein